MSNKQNWSEYDFTKTSMTTWYGRTMLDPDMFHR